jgi:hypothetical protein
LVLNREICQPCEIALPSPTPEGVDVDHLTVGAILEIETGHTTYKLENRGKGKVLISGHATYCPQPVEVDFQGSVGGPALLKLWRIEPGLKMVFDHPEFGIIRTSKVRSVRQLVPANLAVS